MALEKIRHKPKEKQVPHSKLLEKKKHLDYLYYQRHLDCTPPRCILYCTRRKAHKYDVIHRAKQQPHGPQLPVHTEPHQSSMSGRTPRQKEEEGSVGIGEVGVEEDARMEESLISS